EESAIQIAEWDATLEKRDGLSFLSTPDGLHAADITSSAQALVARGVILLGVVDEEWHVHPLYRLNQVSNLSVKAIVGVALNENALHGELTYVIKHPVTTIIHKQSFNLIRHQPSSTLRVLITGWVGSLPLLLKRLLTSYHNIEVTLLDNLSEEKLANEQAYLERRLAEQEGADQAVAVTVKRWNFSNMEELRTYVKSATHIILSQPQESTQEPYTVISAILSHVISIIKSENITPQVFPILSNRDQARLLQEELERFELPSEVHLLVPDEFYGAYVAHTSFHMYTAENEEVYQMKRVLRHMIHDLMSEDGVADALGLHIMDVQETLPDDPEALFASLLEQGYIWVGYRLNHAFIWNDPMQNIVRSIFPRENDFHCLRQHKIIINPFGNPISRRSWQNNREDIAELIVIGENISTDMETSADEDEDELF
ncbi:MAG: hypothetical protein R8M45_03995, partial [Ghiorsea sp.]